MAFSLAGMGDVSGAPVGYKKLKLGVGAKPGDRTGEFFDKTDPNNWTLKGPGTPPAPSSTDSGYGSGNLFEFGGPTQMGGGSSSTFSLNSPGMAPPPFQAPNDLGMSGDIAGHLKDIMNGGQTRFSPAVIDAIKGKLLETTSGRRQANEQAIVEQQKQLGMYRGGQTGKLLAENRMSAASDYTGGVRDVLMAKAQQDFTDKMQAMDAAEKWLGDLRNYALSADMNQIQRAQLQSNIALAWAKLSQDKESMNAQLASNWQLANLARQPIEGRDYILVDDGQGGKMKVPLAALNTAGSFLG